MREAERETGKTTEGLRPARPAAPARVLIAHRPAPIARAPRIHAFTLLELLMVMSLIAVLTSIVLVVGRGVTERSKVSQAKAEMAALAAALEQYKQQYGDYPWTPVPVPFAIPTPPPVVGDSESAVLLFNALCGNVGPKGEQLPDRNGDGERDKGRTFVDLSKFQLWLPEAQLPDPDSPVIVNNWFADPWGKWYYYYYKKGRDDADWISKGFLLYSHGPDGDCNLGDAEDTGLLNEPDPDPELNRDNVYYGRD